MLETIQEAVQQAVRELVDVAKLQVGDLLVVGTSTSEIVGESIGKASNEAVGYTIVESILNELRPKQIYLAQQACEHLNRALLVEREYALTHHLEIVNVKPALDAGGAACVAAYQLAQDPVMVEFVQAEAGLDIGDTLIGMHVKHVQVPVRLKVKQIGQAHVTAASSRGKYIGGPRANY